MGGLQWVGLGVAIRKVLQRSVQIATYLCYIILFIIIHAAEVGLAAAHVYGSSARREGSGPSLVWWVVPYVRVCWERTSSFSDPHMCVRVVVDGLSKQTVGSGCILVLLCLTGAVRRLP